MRRWMLGLLWAVGACARVTADADLTDTDPSADDTDGGAGTPRCDGTFSLDLSLAPETFTTIPTTWEQDGVELQTEPFEGGGYAVTRDADGCLLLAAGTLVVDLIHSGCVAQQARITVTDRCGPACTVALAGNDERVAENRTTRTDVEERLTLAPADPFRFVVVGSYDARLCGIQIDQTPIPEALALQDTGALF